MESTWEGARQRFSPDTRLEQVFGEIVRAVDLGIAVYQADDSADPSSTRLAYANPGYLAATRGGLEEQAGLRAALLEVALGGGPRDFDWIQPGEGPADAVSVHAFPLPDRCVGVSLTNSRTLRLAEQRAVQTLESMSDAFFTLDADWRFTYLNPQCEAILDRRRHDLLGKNMWDEFPEGVGTPFYDAYHHALREQVPVKVEETYEPLGRTLEVRAYPVPSGLAVYFRDVTRERVLEDRVRQNQQLEAVGRVTAGVAHDFNNLVAAIGGYASLGLRNSVDEKARRYFSEIEAASERARELTGQLMAFGRQQELEPTVIDLNEVVAGLSSLLRHVATASVELRVALCPGSVPVFADRSQLDQVLLNLVINGRDAIETTGSVTISTSTEVPAGLVHDVLRPSAWLQVTDTGGGIPPDVRPRIFDPYFSTKPHDTGTGLGLATIHGIVSQSGGSIFVDSALGVGTTMTVVLPAGPGVDQVAAPDAAPLLEAPV